MNAVDIVIDAVKRVEFGPQTTFRNLRVLALSSSGNGEVGYLTLDEALAQGSVHLGEVSESGRVPELKIVNEGALPVLLLDGEELQGAKQNRVLNLTILTPAHQSHAIPVSCVESGRWRRVSHQFAASPHAQFAEGRAAKMRHVTSSLMDSGSRSSDQGDVWNLIAEKSVRLAAPSDTSAMSSMYETHHVSLEEYVAAFRPLEGQAGAVFFVNGQPAGFELFDAPRTWRTLAPKLIRSYALDALDALDVLETLDEEDAAESDGTADARALIQRLISSKSSVFPAVGEGEDVRFDGDDVVGAALVASGKAIHVSAFPTDSIGNKGRRPARRTERDLSDLD